jgi:pyruvate dehydrogenase E1 component beta subunit
MSEMLFRDALGQAMIEEMDRDPAIFLMGEEVAQYNGAYKVSAGMLERFGADRVVDTPIAEAGFVGLGIGAAMAGMRPIIEVMTFNFAILTLDMMINHASKMHYMTNGQLKCPMVLRGATGAPGWLGAQHSHCLEGQYAGIPGLKVVMPGTAADAKGLLKTSIRDDNPVIFLESELMYGWKSEVPDGEHLIPLGVADLKRHGTDLTIISWGRALHWALEAADALAAEGHSVEVVDPRTLRPLDEDAIYTSVRKTNRCVVVEEGWPICSLGASISHMIQRNCFDFLDAPIEHVASEEVPMPYAPNLEALTLPNAQKVIAACKRAMYIE